MTANWKHYLLLNLIVFIWGFTGVLGKEISLEALEIVFFRMGIAYLSMVLLYPFYKVRKVSLKHATLFFGTGVIVGIHWLTFFYAIKISTISVAVVCMSSSTLFTAFLEPLFFKRKISINELFLSIAIVIGIGLIMGFEPEYKMGILVGLISAFLAASFNTINGKFIQKNYPTFQITKYEMLGGLATITALLAFTNGLNKGLFIVSAEDWILLTVLGVICTTLAFLASVWLLKFLTPFTVTMSINMEPIYAILIALVIGYVRGSDSEKMSGGFYVGTLIILGAIFLNAYLKKRRKKVANFS
ncbi:MAG: DMT family transporter [Crocinitomicaceae bacterium]